MKIRNLLEITDKILSDSSFTIPEKQALDMVSLPVEHLFDLLACTNRIRHQNKKNTVFACSIVNAKSGRCSQNCAFCAQSSFHQTGIKTWPLMSEDDLLQRAIEMHKAGATQFSIVTSGLCMTPKELDQVCRTAEKIRKATDLNLCASLGMVSNENAHALMESGISRYHHNLETAESFFKNICTTHQFTDNIKTIENARSAGMKICSGGIAGLGESWKQRVELAFTLKALDVDSIALNFLNPIFGTRLANQPIMSPVEALKCICLFRFVNPAKDITICGGREITLQDFQSMIFAAGANGIMAGNYLTTGGRDIHSDWQMTEALDLTIKGI